MKARLTKALPSAKRDGLSILTTDRVFEVKAIDEANNKVELIDPINPEVVHEVAADAVELYEEGFKIWVSAKAWLKKAGVALKRLGTLIASLLPKRKK